jgi:ferrous iron transport protein A
MSGALPLSFAKAGSTMRVESVHGNAEMHRHLESLGFVDGAELDVVSSGGGTVIVTIKGSRLGLNEQTARHVYVI